MAQRVLTRRLVPARPTAPTIGRCGTLFDRLLAKRPGSRASELVRADLEHQLMRVLAGSGQTGVEHVLDGLRPRGFVFSSVEDRGALRIWRCAVPRRDIELKVQTFDASGARSTYVSYERVVPRRLTQRQRERKRLQDAFYEQYMAAAGKAFGTPPRRLSAAENLLLLIGEFEADVNNGGFSQYLHNKHPSRVRAALKALETVGALQTAGWLSAALAQPLASEKLNRLDGAFDRSREDLAVCTMKYLGNRLKRGQ